MPEPVTTTSMPEAMTGLTEGKEQIRLMREMQPSRKTEPACMLRISIMSRMYMAVAMMTRCAGAKRITVSMAMRVTIRLTAGLAKMMYGAVKVMIDWPVAKVTIIFPAMPEMTESPEVPETIPSMVARAMTR